MRGAMQKTDLFNYSQAFVEHGYKELSMPALDGRSINLALSHRGIRALDEAGISDEISKIMIPMEGRMMHDPNGKLTFQPYGREGQTINSISRRKLNELLMSLGEEPERFLSHWVLSNR